MKTKRSITRIKSQEVLLDYESWYFDDYIDDDERETILSFPNDRKERHLRKLKLDYMINNMYPFNPVKTTYKIKSKVYKTGSPNTINYVDNVLHYKQRPTNKLEIDSNQYGFRFDDNNIIPESNKNRLMTYSKSPNFNNDETLVSYSTVVLNDIHKIDIRPTFSLAEYKYKYGSYDS